MTSPYAEDEELVCHQPVLELALQSQGWKAAWHGRPSVRLVGGSVDEQPSLVSDLLVVPGSASVITRLPVLISDERHTDAALLCSVSNARGGWIVSIDTDGVPVVFSKCLLGADDEIAAACVVDLVSDNRQQATMVTDLFRLIETGLSTTREIAAELEWPLPFAGRLTSASPFDLSRAPELSDEQTQQLRALRDHPHLNEPEMGALTRITMHAEQTPDAVPCAGPLISHADGAVECFGCDDPTERLHVGGSTASCRPHRWLGHGHQCTRCASDRLEADAGVEAAFLHLREQLAMWPWEWVDEHWKVTIATPESLVVWLSVPTPDVPLFRVQVVIDGREVPVDRRPEMALFCAGANRYFGTWNLYLMSDVANVISESTFHAAETGMGIPAELIETAVWRTIRAAVVAAPAVQAVIDGKSAAEALAIADAHDDVIEYVGSDSTTPDDVKLIDEAIAALVEEDDPPSGRTTPTQFALALPASEYGYEERGAVVDARGGTVLVSCYPMPAVPAHRASEVAELMSLISSTGVPFALTLDPRNQAISLRNQASIAGAPGDTRTLLRDLILAVANAPALYERPLHQVAFEDAEPAVALAEVEARFQTLRERRTR